MNIRRVLGYSIRHLYLYKRSLPRLMEVFYWPVLDLVVWGFVSVYLARYRGALPGFVAFLVGALILWDILFKSQQGISISFLEDLWSNNLLNLFVSPMSAGEYVLSLLFISIVKLMLTTTVMVVLARLLYGFDIFVLGLPLIPLAANLIVMGWAVGVVTMAVILRFGQETEVLAWGIALFFQPVSAVFYPVSVLPGWLRWVAWFVPSSHVFEGMRQVVSGGPFPSADLAWAAGLNLVYLAGSAAFFAWNFKSVKRKGLLAKTGT